MYAACVDQTRLNWNDEVLRWLTTSANAYRSKREMDISQHDAGGREVIEHLVGLLGSGAYPVRGMDIFAVACVVLWF